MTTKKEDPSKVPSTFPDTRAGRTVPVPVLTKLG